MEIGKRYRTDNGIGIERLLDDYNGSPTWRLIYKGIDVQIKRESIASDWLVKFAYPIERIIAEEIDDFTTLLQYVNEFIGSLEAKS